MSCFPDSESALKLAITAFASDGGLPALAWAWIASSRSVVRPSCRKKILCPSPHRGAVRNSSPDRKSTRLNSSHSQISYAVFCLKKKENTKQLSGPDLICDQDGARDI